MGQLGDPAPVYVHHVDVSVTAECDLSAIGRPGPREAVVGKHSLTAPVRVDHYDRGRHTARYPAERDLLAIRRPDGIALVYGVVRDLGDAAAVGVHDVDIEVAVAVAVEGNPAREACSGGQAELRSVLGGEGSFGVLTGCEQGPEGEEQQSRKSIAHIPSRVSANQKAGRACASLSRFRDLLPSRPRRSNDSAPRGSWHLSRVRICLPDRA